MADETITDVLSSPDPRDTPGDVGLPACWVLNSVTAGIAQVLSDYCPLATSRMEHILPAARFTLLPEDGKEKGVAWLYNHPEADFQVVIRYQRMTPGRGWTGWYWRPVAFGVDSRSHAEARTQIPQALRRRLDARQRDREAGEGDAA